MMDISKMSKAQLVKIIGTSYVFVPKTKGLMYCRLDDRGISIAVTEDYSVVSTNFHRNVFTNVVSGGYSNPYLWLRTFCECIEANKEFGEVKDKNGNVQGFSFSQLMEHADEMPEEIVKVLQHTERWIYTLSEPTFAVGGDTLQVTNVMCMYFSYLAKSNTMLMPAPSDISRNEFYQKYIETIRYLSLETTLDEEKVKDLKEQIYNIEREAMNKIEILIKDNGGELKQSIAIPKREVDEGEALTEMKNDKLE